MKQEIFRGILGPMSFDGVYRPTEVNTSFNPLSPYLGAYAAAQETAKKPSIPPIEKAKKIAALRKKHENEDEPREDEHSELTEEEKKQVQVFAKMRGLVGFILQEGTDYRFHINSETGLVELLEFPEGKVVLTLTPDELLVIAERANRYMGMMSDHSG